MNFAVFIEEFKCINASTVITEIISSNVCVFKKTIKHTNCLLISSMSFGRFHSITQSKHSPVDMNRLGPLS